MLSSFLLQQFKTTPEQIEKTDSLPSGFLISKKVMNRTRTTLSRDLSSIVSRWDAMGAAFYRKFESYSSFCTAVLLVRSVKDFFEAVSTCFSLISSTSPH